MLSSPTHDRADQQLLASSSPLSCDFHPQRRVVVRILFCVVPPSTFEVNAGFKPLPSHRGAIERGVGGWWELTPAVVLSRLASASSASMKARFSRWRRTDSFVVNRPVPRSCATVPYASAA